MFWNSGERGGGWGHTIHQAKCIALLQFPKMAFALFVGTSKPLWDLNSVHRISNQQLGSISRQLFKQRLKRSCFMVLRESLGGKKGTPWTLKLVFNKISTFPLDQFWVKEHGCSGGSVGGVGEAPPPPLSTLKATPFQENSYHFGWVSVHGKHILHSIAKICNSRIIIL